MKASNSVLIEANASQVGYEASPAGVVAWMNDLLKEPLQNKELAEKMGVSKSYLGHYCTRKGIILEAARRTARLNATNTHYHGQVPRSGHSRLQNKSQKTARNLNALLPRSGKKRV